MDLLVRPIYYLTENYRSLIFLLINITCTCLALAILKMYDSDSDPNE